MNISGVGQTEVGRSRPQGGNCDRTREHLNFEVAKGGVVQPVDKTKAFPQRIKDTLVNVESLT